MVEIKTELTERDREVLALCWDAEEAARAYHVQAAGCFGLALRMADKLERAEKGRERGPLRLNRRERRTVEECREVALRRKNPAPWFMLVVRMEAALEKAGLLEREE